MTNSYNTRQSLKINDQNYVIYSLAALEKKHDLARLPFSLKILLENLLRKEDGINICQQDIDAILHWQAKAEPNAEIAFTPARVILQDFTGVPAVVDLATMREAMQELGGEPEKINPLVPVDLVIDHSVMVDSYGKPASLITNTAIEFERNKERYEFLKWGQNALNSFKVVPPGTGIVHQVNLEYLAKVAFTSTIDNEQYCYPDTLVGTDSHTTMINGLGVLGWGVGGIEAEAAMLGQPITMLIPQVVGFKLSNKLTPGTTATDLVLTVVEMLRNKGVVGKFVEFYGDGLDNLPLADRATIANMAPEFGATCGIFPVDAETLKYLEQSGRSSEEIKLVEEYYRHQGLFRETGALECEYSDSLELDLAKVTASIAGPKRPQDRIALSDAKISFAKTMQEQNKDLSKIVEVAGTDYQLQNGAVVIAAITSCTNTSNPSVMVAAGLIAQKAHALGISSKPWVKTSLAPGSKVVTDYLQKAGLYEHLEYLGFNLVGYGCTTCIGNSGPLDSHISKAIQAGELAVSAVLSGNRNFEGRIHAEVKNAYLASPPLVVAYALAGTMNIDFENDPIAHTKDGKPVFLADIWPSSTEIAQLITKSLFADMFVDKYSSVFEGDDSWQQLHATNSKAYNWNSASTYIKKPPFFDNIQPVPEKIKDIKQARVLVKLQDSVTTDHISPAGAIGEGTPAGQYLAQHNIMRQDFNSYGSRRGNHEIMMRGTFANIRLRNLLAPGTEGGLTNFLPENKIMSIYDASMLYQEQQQDLIIIAGKEYGSGSSRDWAAKGTRLLGVKAVLVESFERIHRSNLIGMGVLPLEFMPGESADKLQLDGSEKFDFDLSNLTLKSHIKITASKSSGSTFEFYALARIDTPKEFEYFQHGGILHYVLRQLATG